MPDQGNIFGNTDGTTNPAQNTPGGTPGNAPGDNLATLLGSIKNERGEPKYKTVEEALNALRHSQEFIPTLKNKNEELERKVGELSQSVTKLTELERVVQELTQNKGTAEPTPQAGLSEEQVAELVARTLSKTQQEAIQKTNLQTVADKVKSKFGDKAEEAFYGRAAELGMSREEFNALAARTPKAVLKLVGIEDTASPAPAPSGFRQPAGINTEGLTPAQDSALGRNTKRIMLGATTEDLRQETSQAKKLVEELEAAGMSINDLTNPKNYNKFFGKVK